MKQVALSIGLVLFGLLGFAYAAQKEDATHNTCIDLDTKANLSIWALGFTDKHFFLLLSSMQLYKIDSSTVNCDRSICNLNLSHVQPEKITTKAGGAFPQNAIGVIGHTALGSFFVALRNKAYYGFSFIHYLNDTTKVIEEPMELDNTFPSGVQLINVDEAGKFVLLKHGKHLVEGSFEGYPEPYKLVVSKETYIGQISASYAIQTGFMRNGVLYGVDNEKKMVYFFSTSTEQPDDPFMEMSFTEFIDCAGHVEHRFAFNPNYRFYIPPLVGVIAAVIVVVLIIGFTVYSVVKVTKEVKKPPGKNASSRDVGMSHKSTKDTTSRSPSSSSSDEIVPKRSASQLFGNPRSQDGRKKKPRSKYLA